MTRDLPLLVPAIAGAALLAACGGSGASDGPDEPVAAVEPVTAAEPVTDAVRALDAPSAAGSGEPNLFAASDGRVWMSWIEADGEGHALRLAVREAGPWTSPGTIARGDDWFVNWADFPSIVELPDGSLAAHWLEKSGPGTYAYGVRVVRSEDGGKTWSDPVTPHTDGTETEHGFVSLFPSGDGVGLVWLDGRKYAGREPGDPGAEMSVRLATVTGDGRVTDSVLLDGRACDCCQTDVARAPGGPIVAYRDRSLEEVRDVSIVRWVRDGWTEPVPVHRDGWTIEACPVNGPALAARGSEVAVAWFTAADETARVLLARSDDGGDSFGAPLRVDLGDPEGRVDLALLDGGDAVVTWLERGEEGAGRVLVRRVGADGRPGTPVAVAETSYARSSGFPRMAVAGGEIVFAWTDPAEPPRVRTATLPLTRLPAD